MSILVRSAGYLTSVQDLGRIGFRNSGVTVGGALDSHGLRVANALVGNEDNAAGLEVTLGTLRLRFEDDRHMAWVGGRFRARVAEREIPPGHVASVAKGEELTMIPPNDGGRAWVAISGGIDVPVVLGSRSTDLRGSFGGDEGRALRAGDSLLLFKAPRNGGGAPWISQWGAPAVWASPAKEHRVIRIVRGTNWDLFTAEAREALVSQNFKATADSDRMGLRLQGPQLNLIEPADLLSEAVVPGTLQVPPNGQPILLLGDCQTIGGYPKIAHVITVDLSIAAQLSPDDIVRFEEVSVADAQRLLREREDDFARFRVGLRLQAR